MPINSKLRTLRVKQYALLAHERGRAIEALAKNLQQRTSIVAEYGCEIEEYALVMQYHAQRALMYASLQEQGSYTKDLAMEVTHAHVQAVKAQGQAIKLYCQAIKAYIRFKNCSEC